MLTIEEINRQLANGSPTFQQQLYLFERRIKMEQKIKKLKVKSGGTFGGLFQKIT